MKSLVPAALVVVLEAGFLFSIASLPSPAARLAVQVQAAKTTPAAPAPAAAPSPAAPRPAAPRASRS
jgi:hypothetical protein